MTTHLRQRMIEDKQRRGLAERTQEAYVAAVRQLAGQYGKLSDQISDEELRQYFFYPTEEKVFSTEAMGGHVYHYRSCDEALYSYHSCKNRHCPKRQDETAEQWLVEQQELLLPTPYFMVTFTLPAGLKQLARRNQKIVYNTLFRTSAAALQQLARDPRFVGGQIGMVGMLHTWARDLSYHPHVHYLVPAGDVKSPWEETGTLLGNASHPTHLPAPSI